ncbi:MAG: DUF4422 domain-containing protein, partial [Oscillospiraceae bacterium]|nr:DUF4422 domain-containing protein [Oscillospiraceae bacterium]
MVFSHRDNGKRNHGKLPEWIVPIQAGSVLTEEKSDAVLDETGENISSENSRLAELTAAYWIWKNDNDPEYKGLCHYRRHFVISDDEIRMLKYNNVDVILTTPRYAPGGVGKMFLTETPVKEAVFENMFEAIKECSTEDIEPFKRYIGKCMYVPNNMVIARNEIYNRYCEWLFPILLKMIESDVETGYGHETDRHIAYAAEMLTSFYFSKAELNKYLTDYKYM